MKSVFYFTLKTLFDIEMFKFLSWFVGYVEKGTDEKLEISFKILDVTELTANN